MKLLVAEFEELFNNYKTAQVDKQKFQKKQKQPKKENKKKQLIKRPQKQRQSFSEDDYDDDDDEISQIPSNPGISYKSWQVKICSRVANHLEIKTGFSICQMKKTKMKSELI